MDGDDVRTIGPVPHEWLFPRTSLIVHHAGAGTTGAALRAGVAQVPVPVAADQPFWAGRAARLGAAPAVLRFQDLTGERLANAITTALDDGTSRARAAGIARRIAPEDGAGRIAHLVAQGPGERSSHV